MSKKLKIKEIPSNIKIIEKSKESSGLEADLEESELENFTEFMTESKASSGSSRQTLNTGQSVQQSTESTTSSDADRDPATLPQVSYEAPRASQITGSAPYAPQTNIRKEERRIVPQGSTVGQTGTLRQSNFSQSPIAGFQDPSMVGGGASGARREHYEEKVQAEEAKVERKREENEF